MSRDSENTEYLEIDLGSMHVISKTLTQGRFGNGRGQEYAEAYKIQYWRPGMVNFIDYRDSLGRMVSQIFLSANPWIPVLTVPLRKQLFH